MADHSSQIPIAKPFLGEAEIEATRRVIESGWLTQGPEVAAFEREFAAYVGASHACAVSNCTTALHLALLAVGVKPGDEVVTVSHSFIATANSIRYCGAVPVFVDIDSSTYNIDAALIERVVTSKTRAILCVHQLGMPCDLRAVLEVAGRHGLPVIEDAACAIGSELLWNGQWEKVGKPHGDIACFSFHPRKVVTTGDGGMLTTANAEWDKKFRLWRQHGMSVPDTVRHKSREVIVETYPEIGFNYRMTDIQAAVGREQIKRLPDILDRRRALGARYGALLSRIAGFRPPCQPEWARSNWQSYSVRLPDGVDQREIMQLMLDRGISIRAGVMCAHQQPAYQGQPWACESGFTGCTCPGGRCTRLTVSEQAHKTTIVLPLYAQMTHEEQDRVVTALEQAVSSLMVSEQQA